MTRPERVLICCIVSQAVDYIMHQPDGKPTTAALGASSERILTSSSPLNADCAWGNDRNRSVRDLRKRRVTSRLGVECVYASPGRGRSIHLYYFSPNS